MDAFRAKILVVDDTKTNIEVLEGILSAQYDVIVAMSGEKALYLAEKVHPDLILLDVMMPEMDGYQTLKNIRENPAIKDIPVFFLTAKSDRESERYGLNLGAVDYIAKPFMPELILLRIKNQLEYKRQRDHLHELVAEKTEDLRKTLKVLLTSLGALAEYRDPETGEHIRRTQFIVQRLAQELLNDGKFPDYIRSNEYVDYYATAAPLHDIGKVGIQDEILRKPGRLNEAERRIMMMHPQMGYDVLLGATKELGGSPMVRIAADKGDQIPIGARLMAVADVYDALVSRRPYKDPYPHDVAVREIISEKGTQFDPDVIDAFVKISDSLPAIYEQFKDAVIDP